MEDRRHDHRPLVGVGTAGTVLVATGDVRSSPLATSSRSAVQGDGQSVPIGARRQAATRHEGTLPQTAQSTVDLAFQRADRPNPRPVVSVS